MEKKKNIRNGCRFFHFSVLLTAMAAAFLFTSCSGSPPDIAEINWELRVVNNRDFQDTYEELSVFLNILEDDGIEDIDSLYVISDKAALYWHLTKDNWQEVTKDSSTWIGSSNLSTADYSEIPRGDYRIVVTDKGGRRDEGKLNVSTPEIKRESLTFPEGAFKEKSFTMEGENSDYLFLFFSKDGRPLARHQVKGKELPLSQLRSLSGTNGTDFHFYIHTKNQSPKVGLLQGPYYYSKGK